MKPLVIIFLFSFSLLSNNSLGEIYQWVDENGKKHFSDSKPQHVDNVTEKKLRTTTVKRDSESFKNQQQMRHLLNQANAQREAEKEQAQRDAKVAERKKRYCQRAKSNLDLHKNTARTVEFQKDGSRRYFSSEERVAQGKALKAKVKKYCR